MPEKQAHFFAGVCSYGEFH